MSTTTNQQVSTNLVSTLNPNDYITKGIHELTTEYFKLVNPEQRRNIKTLFIGFGILLTADIAKTVVQNLITENKQHINNELTNILKYMSFTNMWHGISFVNNKFWLINKKIYNMCFKKPVTNIVYELDNSNVYVTISIKYDEIFMNNLVMILNSQRNVDNGIYLITYDKVTSNNIQLEKNDIQIVNQLNNIKIKYDNIVINCDNLEFKSNLNNNMISSISLKSETISQFMFTRHALTDIFINIYRSGVGHKNSKTSEESFLNYLNTFPRPEIITDHDNTLKIKFIYDVPIMFLNNLTSLNLKKQEKKKYGDYYILESIHKMPIEYLKTLNNADWMIFISNFKALFRTPFICDEIIKINKKNNNIAMPDGFMTPIYGFLEEGNLINKHFVSQKDYISEINAFKQRCLDIFATIDNNDNQLKLKEFTMSVTGPSTYSQDKLKTKLFDFINYVGDFSKRQNVNNSINIYTIKVTEQIVKTKAPNQKYEEYMKNKESLGDTSTADIFKLLGPEPNKEIEVETKKSKIDPVQINNRYASFKNLYLQKQQDEYLYNIVESFQKDKDMMNELGIPNKLNILLHGEPGCGKTTTIVTIASYFGRDIFYVNLKNIRKNEELKNIFDYVNNIHTGGGIIIFEDIDAMTNIVKKRETNIDVDLTETGDDSLTLEYLLNVLDGTQTYKESITIITTNHINKLDPALYRAGRIDYKIEMRKCDHYQLRKIYKRFIQRDIDENVLYKIPEYTYTPAQVIFHLKSWVKKRNEKDEIIMEEFMN
jgi:ATP-dependent 26S proteasome regulatory subunit